jgi:NAD(P)-dependent dehydrogenase (short-subunit alcohol dehydrogenase family)
MRLEGVVGLVTGGASGLGRATADALVSRGATVVALDLARSLERMETGPGIVPVAADVTDPDAVQAAIDAAAEHGDLRVCVNCAGIDGPERTARKGVPADLDKFRRVVEVNLVGTFNVLRLAAATMQGLEPVDGERGVIVNTASIAAFDGQAGQASYAASKGAITAMTLPIARDLASSLIRVLTIAPGLFDTPLLSGLPTDVYDSLAKAVPNPSRLGETSEFASLVAHMAENPYLNGDVVRIDGALRLGYR